MPSYLDETFLGGPEDDNYEVGSADNLPAVADSPMTPPGTPAVPMVRLPGGVVMPRSTALILLAVAIAIAIYIWRSNKRKE